MIGEKIKTKMFKSGAVLRAVISGDSFASVFGEISPITKSSTVIINVAMVTPFAPNRPIKSAVASADDAIFTTLFPISTVERILSYVSSILSTSLALLLFAARFFSLIRLREEKAISQAEKNEEKHRSTSMKISRKV